MPVISHIRATALKKMRMPDSTLYQEPKQPKLLDQVRQYLHLHHYSIYTERSYVDWIVRFIRFHRMRSRDDLFPAEPKIVSELRHYLC
jgi:Phage integrase, N-terminal SAM-like domain